MTRAWRCYERGRAYNDSLTPNQYRLVNTNIEFFAGNQWINIPETPAMSRLPRPTFNIIKRVVSLFVASLTSSGANIHFEPLYYYGGEGGADPDGEAARIASAEVSNLLEKFKMEYRIREALFDGAQTGDYCAHFYWDPEALPYGGVFGAYRGEICMEMIDGINVMFGNPACADVQKQPYVLIVGRDTVENLRREARRHGADPGGIKADGETGLMPGAGGKTEPGDEGEAGKALFCYLYTKKTRKETVTDPHTGLEREESVSSVYVTKATRETVIYDEVDTGLSRYPIAWGNWEKQKNQYHGRALVTGIIPNQIYINSMFAMVMRHLQLLGFPKTIFNADLVGQWSNEVGQAVGVRNLMPGQDIGQVAYNLQPADMSSQIIATIDKAMAYTKDCLGATDAQMGNVRPDNTSALMVLQSSAEVPLENTRAGLYEWMEDIGAVLLDMMGTYYGRRPILRQREFEEPELDEISGQAVVDPGTGLMRTRKVTRRVTEDYDFSGFKRLWLSIRADVGATTYYSEIAMVQTLDNLRREGILDIVSYLERIPDRLIPRKAELLDALRAQTEQSEAGGGKAGGAVYDGPLDADLAIASLPGRIQGSFNRLPKQAQRALIQRQGME